MRWSEYQEQLEQLKEKTENLLVDEEVLSETAEIKVSASNTRTCKVVLGDKVTFILDGKPAEYWDVKGLYSARTKGFQELLGGLKTKVSLAENLHAKLAKILVEPYIKEMVLERLVEQTDIPDDNGIIKAVSKKRIEMLSALLPDTNRDVRGTYPLQSPSRLYKLNVEYRFGNGVLTYGTSPEAMSIKNCWSLLNHYAEIENTIHTFVKMIRPVHRLCERG